MRKAKITELHHISIRVPDLDKAVKQWTTAFNIPVLKVDDIKKWGYKLAFFKVGTVNFVLLEDYGKMDFGATHNLIMKHSGPTDYGFFHMAFLTDDIDTMIKEMIEAGVNMYDNPAGVEGYDGARFSFIDPKDTSNTLIHLYEAKW